MANSGSIRSAFADDDETEAMLGSFKPKPKTKPVSVTEPKARTESSEKVVEKVAQKRGFQERAKPKKKAMRRSRYYETGRNTQIAVKGRAEDKERIAALCGQQDWVQGQLIEYALDALSEKIADPKSDFWNDRNFKGVD